MNCPMCSSTSSEAFAVWPDFEVRQCRDCGFRFVDTAAAGYPRDAQRVDYDVEPGPVVPGLPHIQRRVRDILRFRQPPGRAIDIGCDKGELSLALEESGFECTGIDLKAGRIASLQARFPSVAWHRATVAELAVAQGRFDVLTMYHVLEHISDPKALLAVVKALANPGALVVIEVPNAGGLEARLKGRRWHYYKVDHVNYFRASDLRKLAASLDLTVLGVRGYQHFSYPQDVPFKDFVKGAFGALGFQDVISIFLRV